MSYIYEKYNLMIFIFYYNYNIFLHKKNYINPNEVLTPVEVKGSAQHITLTKLYLFLKKHTISPFITKFH